jgi:hypothetical protein
VRGVTTEMYHYRNVSASVVNSDLRVAAEMASAAAAKELKLGPVTIQWYKAVDSAGESDWSADRPEKGHSEALNRSQIWLNIDHQGAREVMVTAAHEIKHLAQFQDGSLPKYELLITKDMQRSTEHEAESFGQAIAYRLSDEPTPTPVLYHHEPDEGASLFKEATRLLRIL